MMKDSGKVLFQEVDESIGGRVMGTDSRVILQLWFDFLGQLLPEFDAVSRKQQVSDASPFTPEC